MGKKRNRKKRVSCHGVNADDDSKFPVGNSKSPKDGKDKSPTRDEKAWESASEKKPLDNSLPIASSTESEPAQEVGCLDQKKYTHEEHKEIAKDNFPASEASWPRCEVKSTPALRSLNYENTTVEKSQQIVQSSAEKDAKNPLRKVEKDDPQVCKESSVSNVKTPLQIFRTEDNSPKHQTESVHCTLGGSSVTSRSSVNPCSPIIELVEETGGTLGSDVSPLGTVTEKRDVESKGKSAESLQATQSAATCIRPTQFKSENRSSASSSVYNTMLEDPRVYFSQNRKSCSNARVSTASGNRTISRPGIGFTFRNPAGNPKKCFEEALKLWLPIRNDSIHKLRKLLENALKNEVFYDNVQLNCKYGSAFCKEEKIAAPQSTWSSFGSMFCDIASGLTSVAHMFDTDGMQSEFQEVMDADAVATKEMYDARSRYTKEYQYTEEITRKFGGTTLGETLEKISEAVGITEFFQKMEKASNNKEDTGLAAIAALDSIMDRNSNRDVGREVVDAVQELVYSNPACVGTAASVGRSLYGATDLRMASVKRTGNVGAIVTAGTREVDRALVRQDWNDIAELQRKTSRGSQSTLSKRIQQALDTFIQEKGEMLDLLNKL